MVLAWAQRNSDIQQPNGWLEGIRLPRETFHGREVVRTELEPEQTLAIIGRLTEPYATLVLFLATLGRRIEEAVGLQPGDLDEANVLTIRRVVYSSEAVPLKEDECKCFRWMQWCTLTSSAGCGLWALARSGYSSPVPERLSILARPFAVAYIRLRERLE
jgi:hypothetical protein